ncbi:NYN domain-containing protein [Candidatus Parcubacteria bacterium]|nr:NYN domain-containing protein [Candidatus Parcubacteria bacterium]
MLKRKEREEVLSEIGSEIAKILEELKEMRDENLSLKERLSNVERVLRELATLIGQREEKEKEEGKFVIIVDWDNLNWHLKHNNLAFPAESIIEEIRNVFGKEVDQALIFFHKLSPFYAPVLKRAGWRLVFCPPLTRMGKDTVDEEILIEAQRLAENKEISGVVLISGDKDMIPALNLLQNAGKEVVLVQLDTTARVLKEKRGLFQIRLSSLSRLKEKEEVKVNSFFILLEFLKNPTVSLPLDDPNFIFLLWVISKLPEKATKEMERGFENLVDCIWADAYALFSKRHPFSGISKESVKQILTLLLNRTDLLLKEELVQSRFYLFNHRSLLWSKTLTIIKEVLRKEPKLKSIFKIFGESQLLSLLFSFNEISNFRTYCRFEN